ncbi:uncharacterized protein SPPG_01295 [Spizellomyces punctatus DAOM BR117]|uniref:Uncharacterized protein n=1 Tax=Spizellomyces punctatus (strain DAOM BR117) TaxID=645134 RepID=A0A0L0HSJ2_SPIPD|nr:uncharacterized protein SPPG_01295 [Spizellomyces punctatus DAOM BR117]KND03839.1 hypothetical protein SPPG_01295 [Spizellomyces punctatus DAOM BR117]|eukprot:XP_016611878.1 hypothetical protein SPPG_01295 [Spizellomyces punctatus DAOM BR117]
MQSRITPSNLQSFNNDLVKNLEHLRDQREAIEVEINKEECRKDDLQQQIHELTDQLERVKQSLTKKYTVRNEYDRLIQDTETAYQKIVESSQTLLELLQRESQAIASHSGRGICPSTDFGSHV